MDTAIPILMEKKIPTNPGLKRQDTMKRLPIKKSGRPFTMPLIKKKLRVAAEEEEREFYSTRAPQEWLDALAPFGTDSNKPFLETAPYLIAIFSKSFDLLEDGTKQKTYYLI